MSTLVQVVTILSALNQPVGMKAAAYIFPQGTFPSHAKCVEYGTMSANKVLVPAAQQAGFREAAQAVVMCLPVEDYSPQVGCAFWVSGGFQCTKFTPADMK